MWIEYLLTPPQIKYGHVKTDKGWTFGGYSASQTLHQRFIVKVGP